MDALHRKAHSVNSPKHATRSPKKTGRPTDARIVEDDIESSELGHSLVNHALDIALLADIAGDSNSFRGIGHNLAYQRDCLLYCFGADVSAYDVGAFGSEQDGRLESDAAAGDTGMLSSIRCRGPYHRVSIHACSRSSTRDDSDLVSESSRHDSSETSEK